MDRAPSVVRDTTRSGRKQYTIALSSSSIGNDWRAQMEKEVQAEAQTPGDKPLIKKLIIENSGQNASAQISQMSSLIAQHVSAIIVDAASTTALNNVIAQAHARHIVVVSFDNLVTSPYAIKQNYNNLQWGATGAAGLAKLMHYKGGVVMLEGIAGAPAEVQRETGVLNTFKKYPNMKVVSRVNGNWNQSGGHSAMASVLVSGVKFNGVWSSGDMAGGAFSALQQSHHPLVPMTDAAFNNFLQILAQNKGQTGVAVGDSDWSGAAALNTALKALQGQKVPMNIVNPISAYSAKDYKSSLPGTFNDDYTSPVLGPQGQLTTADVQSGTCCKG